MKSITILKYNYSTSNQGSRHIAYEAIQEINEMKEN